MPKGHKAPKASTSKADDPLNKYQAAAHARLSPTLLEWLTKNAPKSGLPQKLQSVSGKDGAKYFTVMALDEFSGYLALPWPCAPGKRPNIPTGIETEVREEASFRCVICGDAVVEVAHIDPVHNSKNNHPHNLILLCPTCHTRFDTLKTIKPKEIRSIKDSILDVRATIWRGWGGLAASVWGLVKELEVLKKKAKKSDSTAYEDLRKEVRDTIRKKAKSSDFKKEHQDVATTITAALTDDDDDTKLFAERKKYLKNAELSDCPLCQGTGSHHHLDCPVCKGDGTVSAKIVDEIDLSPYDQLECPLCEGSGTHNNWECPICRSEGTIDARLEDQIDLSPYDQLECPLCKKSGVHNGQECPICRGEGSIDAKYADDIDLSPYEQMKCPLCKGRGTHNNWECPICRGEGTIDAKHADDIDLSPYEQVKCPLCKGKREYRERECPACRGEGTIDARGLEDFDRSRYEDDD